MQEMGFLHHVVDTQDDMAEMANALAGQIARNAPLALRAAKRVRWELAEKPTNESMAAAESIRRTLDGTTDCLEGLAAFAEKRDPVFTGH